MGRKPVDAASGFALDAADEIRRAMEETGMTNRELLERSGISSNYFYVRMRGEKPFTLNDIGRMADALGVEPSLTLHRPAGRRAAHGGRRR